MASKIPDTNASLPVPQVTVHFGEQNPVYFQELGGVAGEHEGIEYRHGDTPIFYPIKMPGLGRVGNVVLRKGIFAGDARFWAWYEEIKLNQVKPETVVLQLVDESGAPTMIWALHKARPTVISDCKLEAEGNEVPIELLELEFETLTVSALKR